MPQHNLSREDFQTLSPVLWRRLLLILRRRLSPALWRSFLLKARMLLVRIGSILYLTSLAKTRRNIHTRTNSTLSKMTLDFLLARWLLSSCQMLKSNARLYPRNQPNQRIFSILQNKLMNHSIPTIQRPSMRRRTQAALSLLYVRTDITPLRCGVFYVR